jgi:hypothetical protein
MVNFALLTTTFQMHWFCRAEWKICVYCESKWTMKEAAPAYLKHNPCIWGPFDMLSQPSGV